MSWFSANKTTTARDLIEVPRKHDLRLAADFFFIFARFEYALKMAGFLRPTNDAKVDWRAVASEVEPVFVAPEPEDFAGAVEYIYEEPPKKQCNDNGRVVWQEVIPQTDLESDKVLQYVRRIRNNLFHGGKFAGGYLDDPPRAEKLMNCAIVIIDKCMERIPSVQDAFRG